jgi:hypothetical protein
VACLPETQPNSIAGLIGQARQRLSQELQALQAQLETLGRFTPAVSLDKVLASVRNLITATLPEQVFATLAEEAEQMGVRAAVFDIRGKAAWGASARGFGPEVSDKAFRALVVPLNKDNPFRQAYETGGHVDATVELLKKSRNVLDKFNPSPNEPILLLPIRSAGSVSAIFYSDPGGRAKELPVDALKILAEFAGAQLDRLMALGGGPPGVAAERRAAEAEPVAAHVSSQAEGFEPAERVASRGSLGVSVAQASSQAAAPSGYVVEPPAITPAPQAQSFDIAQLNEDDQKVHKDAKRFAKLLISEIDLYNKAKVADGRKNSDLYRRLKADIDRSRQTYEKRFGKTLSKRYDYFHEELVRTLAGNEPSLLGSDYPGPSV